MLLTSQNPSDDSSSFCNTEHACPPLICVISADVLESPPTLQAPCSPSQGSGITTTIPPLAALTAASTAAPVAAATKNNNCWHLQLVNALSACVISARMPSHHRQWSAQQLFRALARNAQPSYRSLLSGGDNQVRCSREMLM